jgi:hypothetical protein
MYSCNYSYEHTEEGHMMESDFGIVNVVAMFETDIIRQYAFISITDISKQFMYIMRGSYSFNIILCLLTCII